jgi:hypothetical protein
MMATSKNQIFPVKATREPQKFLIFRGSLTLNNNKTPLFSGSCFSSSLLCPGSIQPRKDIDIFFHMLIIVNNFNIIQHNIFFWDVENDY